MHLHHLLEVLHHSGVHLHLKVHHLLSKVRSPLMVVLHSHEEDYHHLL
jgi:hypothetical protein